MVRLAGGLQPHVGGLWGGMLLLAAAGHAGAGRDAFVKRQTEAAD